MAMTPEEAAASMMKKKVLTPEGAAADLKGGPPEGEAPTKSFSQLGILGALDDVINRGLFGSMIKSTVGLPGIPGDLQQFLKKYPNTDLGKLAGQIPDAPTSSDFIDYMQQKTGEIPEPQTSTGRLVGRIGEFLTPNITGKGRVARDVLTAVGAGAGSKGAEELNSYLGDLLPPGLAKALGGLTGLFIGGRLPGPGTMPRSLPPASAIKQAAGDAPSPAVLKDQTDAAYAQAATHTNLDRRLYANAVSDMMAEAEKRGLHRSAAPETFKQVETLLNKNPLNFAHVEAVRQQANRDVTSGMRSGNAHQETAGKIVVDKINDFYDKAAASDPALQPDIDTARALGRANALSTDVSEARLTGEFNPRSQAIGEMNAVRNWAKKQTNLTPLEREAVKRAVGAEAASSPLRTTARALQSGPAAAIGTVLSVAKASAKPLFTTGVLSNIGKAVEGGSDVLTKKKLDELEAVLRTTRAGQQKALASARTARAAQNSALLRSGILGAIQSGYVQSNAQQKRDRERRDQLPPVNLPMVPGWPVQGQ